MKYAFMPVLVCHGLFFSAHSAHAQEPLVPVAVTISLEKSVLTQHEPAMLKLSFENQTQQGIVISLGYEDEKMEIKIVDPEGRIFRKPRPILRQGFGTPDTFYAAGNSSSAGYVVLSEWFSFEKTGVYQIEVSLSPASSPNERFSYSIRSSPGPISLTVVPRNQEALERACAALLAGIQNMHSSAVALNAAKALSRVNDPAAVPYLAAATKSKLFASMMIEALGRLRTKDAVAALISASHSKDAETKALATAALASLGEAGRQFGDRRD